MEDGGGILRMAASHATRTFTTSVLSRCIQAIVTGERQFFSSATHQTPKGVANCFPQSQYLGHHQGADNGGFNEL